MLKEPKVVFETEIPEDSYLALQAQGIPKDELGAEARLSLAVKFFADGTLSFGQAKNLAGMSYLEFTDYLNQLGIPRIRIDEEYLQEEMAAVNAILKNRE